LRLLGLEFRTASDVNFAAMYVPSG